MSVCSSVQEVLDCSDIVISLVTPGAALQVAQTVAGLLRTRRKRLIYVDANSIAPSKVLKISEVLRSGDIDLVDGSIRGLASELKRSGVLYLSGPHAAEISEVFVSLMRVKVVGDKVGLASGLKMALSGLPKGIVSLFVEVIELADRMGVRDEVLDVYRQVYPGVMEVVQRMLPTYPQHARRRSEELDELEATMVQNEMHPCVISAARQVTSSVAEIEWEKEDNRYNLSVDGVIAAICRHQAEVRKQS